MIISHKLRCVFVQLPRTGSTAIARELISHYQGTPILNQHSNYVDFLRVATASEREYFVFSCILQFIVTYIDKDTIMFIKPRMEVTGSDNRLLLKSNFPRFDETYKLGIVLEDPKSNPDPKGMIEGDFYIGDYFDRDGNFAEDVFVQAVQGKPRCSRCTHHIKPSQDPSLILSPLPLSQNSCKTSRRRRRRRATRALDAGT